MPNLNLSLSDWWTMVSKLKESYVKVFMLLFDQRQHDGAVVDDVASRQDGSRFKPGLPVCSL